MRGEQLHQISGARLSWEYFGKGYFNVKGVSIPVAVSVFLDELYPAPRSRTARVFSKLIQYNRLDQRWALCGVAGDSRWLQAAAGLRVKRWRVLMCVSRFSVLA